MKIIQSKLLNSFKNLSHAFTTREGGVSTDEYESLNLAFHVGDSEKNVIQNHKIVAKKMLYEYETLIHMKQIHSDIVHTVTKDDNFFNPPTADALITDKKNTPLMVMVADCTPVLFYDSNKKVIGVAHVGRAGAFKNIIQNLINKLDALYNSKPKDITVAVGVGIKSCCYEVKDDIYKEAKKLKMDYAILVKENRYYLDINKIIKTQLSASEIPLQNIEFLDGCSCCLNKAYFSYRASKATGRFCGVLMLN